MMAFFEEIPTYSTFKALLVCAVSLFLVYRAWLSYESPSKRVKLPPSASLLRAVWCYYRHGLPIYEYMRQLKYVHGSMYRMNIFGYQIVVMNDFESIKEAFGSPDISDRPDVAISDDDLQKGKISTLLFHLVFGAFSAKCHLYTHTRVTSTSAGHAHGFLTILSIKVTNFPILYTIFDYIN